MTSQCPICRELIIDSRLTTPGQAPKQIITPGDEQAHTHRHFSDQWLHLMQRHPAVVQQLTHMVNLFSMAVTFKFYSLLHNTNQATLESLIQAAQDVLTDRWTITRPDGTAESASIAPLKDSVNATSQPVNAVSLIP